MPPVADDELIHAGPWPAGINNLAKEGEQPTDENGRTVSLREADNVDLTDQGAPRRRRGYALHLPLELGHSAWSHPMLDFGLFVTGGVLHALDSSGSAMGLGVDVGELPLSYALLGDRVYFSSRIACGMLTMDLQAYAWAPPAPAGQPAAAAVDGFALDPGQYQIAVTYTDALGRESGSTLAAAVDVAGGQGIELSAIPQPDDGLSLINVYCTGPDDQVLKLSTTLPAGTAYAVIGLAAAGRTLSAGLQMLRPMPPGAIVRGQNGRQFVAAGHTLYWSPALRYGMYDRVAARVHFSAEVSMVEPVGSADGAGLFVAAGKRTYWLSGADPAEFTQQIVYGHGVVPGTSMLVSGDVLGFDTVVQVAVWIATNGQFCAGLPGGQVVPLKLGQAAVDASERGAILLREQSGIQQLVATLTAPMQQGLAVTDRAVAHVIKGA